MPARVELGLPSYTCMILTEGRVKLVSSALDAFVKDFDAQYQEALRQFKGNLDLFEGVSALVKKSFHFAI